MNKIFASVLLASLYTGCSQEDPSFSEQTTTTVSQKDPNSADATTIDHEPENEAGETVVLSGSTVDGSDDSGDGAVGTENTNSGGDENGVAGNGNGSETTASGTEGTAGNEGTPSTGEQIIASCANALKITQTVQVTFPSRQDCSWGIKENDGSGNLTEVMSSNGNLSILNGWIRAREENTVAIAVPANTILCELDIDSNTNSIHFDDYFALRLENYVVASSKVLTDALSTDADGHYLWDWAKIRGDGNTANGTLMVDKGKYCGTGNCALPEHDTPGNFDIGFSLNNSSETAAMNAKLFSKLSNLTQIKMTATATGDNDNADCFHSGGNFTVTIQYVEKAM